MKVPDTIHDAESPSTLTFLSGNGALRSGGETVSCDRCRTPDGQLHGQGGRKPGFSVVAMEELTLSWSYRLRSEVYTG